MIGARRQATVGALVVALAVPAVALSACGGTTESTARSFHEAFQEWTKNRGMSEAMKEEAIRAAEGEPVVKKLLAGQEVKSAGATRFVGSDGKTPIGAAVTLRLTRPIDMHSVEVPVWLTPRTPDPKAPLAIQRFVHYTGTGIDELKVILALPAQELLEVQPFGTSVEPPEPGKPSIAGFSYDRVGEH